MINKLATGQRCNMEQVINSDGLAAVYALLLEKAQRREKEKPCREGQGIQGNDAGASFASNHTPSVTTKSNETAL